MGQSLRAPEPSFLSESEGRSPAARPQRGIVRGCKARHVGSSPMVWLSAWPSVLNWPTSLHVAASLCVSLDTMSLLVHISSTNCRSHKSCCRAQRRIACSCAQDLTHLANHLMKNVSSRLHTPGACGRFHECCCAREKVARRSRDTASLRPFRTRTCLGASRASSFSAGASSLDTPPRQNWSGGWRTVCSTSLVCSELCTKLMKIR